MADTRSRRCAKRVAVGWIALAAIVTSGGCVTKSRYDVVVAERDAVQIEKERLDLRSTELAVQLETTTNDALILDDQLQRKSDTLAQVEETHAMLIDQLASEVEAGKITIDMMRSGLNIRISEEILFESGSAQLDSGGRAVLKRLAKELETIAYQVVVAGHSDNVPIGEALTERYPTNWDLAGARSARVVAVLQECGIPREQLLSVSFGSNQPLASNDTPEGRSQNRRIEVRIRPVLIESERLPDVAAPPPWD